MAKDYSGQKYGKLEVIQHDKTVIYENGGSAKLWIYKCDCGYIRSSTITKIKHSQACPKCNIKNAGQKKHLNTEDFTGKHIGKLTVLHRINSEQRGHTKWECQCQCGSIVYRNSTQLRHNEDSWSCPNCGKQGKHIKILAQSHAYKLEGQKFGDLVAIQRIGSEWQCQCKCGNITTVRTNSLINGYVKQCEQCRTKLSSVGEKYIADILTKFNIKYIPQKTFKGLIGNYARLRFDFYFVLNELEYIVEVDGAQHHHQIDFFGNLEQIQQVDNIKDIYCKDHNINLLRLNFDNMNNLINDTNKKLIPILEGGDNYYGECNLQI